MTTEAAVQCGICFGEKPNEEFAHLPRCGHAYCRECLRATFESQTLRLGVKTQFFCPSCDASISTEEALAYVSPEFSQKFNEWVVAAAVVPTLKDNVYQIWERARSTAAEFSKGRLCSNVTFAFVVVLALLRAVLPSRNTLWLMAFAKKCPGCGCSVEKTGGCKHMECRSCYIHFCWHCGYTARDSSPIYCHVCRPWGVLRMSGPVGLLIMMFIAAIVLWLGSGVLSLLGSLSALLHEWVPLYTMVAYYPWALVSWFGASIWGLVLWVAMLPVNLFIAVAPAAVMDVAVWALGWGGWAWGYAWGGVWAVTDTVLGGVSHGLGAVLYMGVWRGLIVTLAWHGVLGQLVAFLLPKFLVWSFLSAELNAVLYLTVIAVAGAVIVAKLPARGAWRNNNRGTYYGRPVVRPQPRRRRRNH